MQLPLLCIQILLAFKFEAAPVAPAAVFAPEEASNMSANGLPNCNKSSEAFVVAAAAVGCAEAAPNKSTIGAPAELAGGDDKKGFVSAALAPPAPLLVGEDTLD